MEYVKREDKIPTYKPQPGECFYFESGVEPLLCMVPQKGLQDYNPDVIYCVSLEDGKQYQLHITRSFIQAPYKLTY